MGPLGFKPRELVSLGLSTSEIDAVVKAYITDPETRGVVINTNTFIHTAGLPNSDVLMTISRTTGRPYETLLADTIRLNLR